MLSKKISHFFKIIILMMCVSGCIAVPRFQGLSPIEPSTGNPSFTSTVDSLQPTLSWEKDPISETTYDLIIWKAYGRRSKFDEAIGKKDSSRMQQGEQVYYIEGLRECSHRVTISLDPDTYYFWSVRSRRGDKTGDWSYYNYDMVMAGGSFTMRNSPYRFKTP